MVKKILTIPEWMNEEAMRLNINFSQVLQQALYEKIHLVAEVEVINAHKPTDGVVEQLIYEIPYKALPAALVEKIEVDVAADESEA